MSHGKGDASVARCGCLALATLFGALAGAADLPRPASPLQLSTPAGAPVSLAGMRGKVVLLEFFMTDCRHCQRFAGTIEPLYKEWRSRGLEVLAVAIDAEDAPRRIAEFRERFGVSYPIAVGDAGMLRDFGKLPAGILASMPHIFLIDRRGIIRFEHPGSDRAFYDNDAANLRQELDKLLKEPAPAAKSAGKTARKRS